LAKEEYDDYLKFIEEAQQLAQQVPRYFSKYSKHCYTNQQKITILVLMQKLKLTYRSIVSWLRTNPLVCELLGLSSIPVHTTLVRCAQRVEKIILSLLGIRQAHIAAVDATGFELEEKSFYYRYRYNSERLWKVHKFMKLSVAVDTEKQIILTCCLRKKVRNDTIDFKRLLKDLKIDYVVADKGYDSKENRNFVLYKLQAMPIIPVRWHTHFYGYLRGCKKIDGSNYHQRSKVETIFSVIKRKYGSVLRARSFRTQKVEVICKLVAYNIDRTVNYLLVLVRGLHQSLSSASFVPEKRYLLILGKLPVSMRFKHLSLDEQLKETEKTDKRTVAKAQLLKSKEWQDHIAEHHGTGQKAQLVEVTTSEDSGLSKKTEEKKKEDEKEELLKQQHTVEHAQTTTNSGTGYLSGTTSGTAQRGPGDAYFGAGSAKLQAISGQCSCGMEVSTGWTLEPTTEQKLKSGYTMPLERATPEHQDQAQLFYSTGTAPNTLSGQQERPLYSAGQPSLGAQQGQKHKRTTAL